MKVITIAGHIGRDAETKSTSNGQSVTEFSVAVSGRGRNSEETTWFRVSLWGDFGSKLAPYLVKGKSVTVQGDLNVRTYEQNGETRVSLDVTGRDLTLGSGGGRNQETVNEDVEETEAAPF